jgi:hypothetical protein
VDVTLRKVVLAADCQTHNVLRRKAIKRTERQPREPQVEALDDCRLLLFVFGMANGAYSRTLIDHALLKSKLNEDAIILANIPIV